MKIQTKAVHAGDRKKPGPAVPDTTPIYTATSYFYESMEQLDRVFGREEPGYCYARYDNPTNAALEELVTALESGHGALACASGMAALHIAMLAALTDRRKSILAANALYGATVSLLMNVLEPLGVAVRFVDICDLEAVEKAAVERKPGCILMETISNPLLRVGAIAGIAAIAERAGAALVVDNTFATPLLVRPLELGANFVVHSVTKYLAGHGDVLGGVVVADEEHLETVRSVSRTIGPVLGPFESYLTMRGIKTFPLRMERQCANACRVASWLARHPKVERVYFPGDPAHPDAAAIRRLFPPGLYGAMVSFEMKDAARDEDLPLHGRAADDRARHLAGRRAQHDALSGDVLAPRDLAEAARAHGHSRQSGAAVGGHRGGGRHHRRSGSGSRLGFSGVIQRPFQILLTHRRADEQFLPGPRAQRNRLPTVLRGYRDPDLDLAACVAYRTDHAGNDGTNLRIRREQSFQHPAHSIDDAVFDLEPVLSRAQTHCSIYLQPSSPRNRTNRHDPAARDSTRLSCFVTVSNDWSRRVPTGITNRPGSLNCRMSGLGTSNAAAATDIAS